MNFSPRRAIPLISALSDAAVVYASFWLAFQLRFHYEPFTRVFPITKGVPPWHFYHDALQIVVPLWVLVFALFGNLYRKRFHDAADEFMAVAKGVILGTTLIIAATFLYRHYEYSRLVMAASFFFSIALLFLSRESWKLAAGFLFGKMISREKVFILGEGRGIETVVRQLGKEPHIQPRAFPSREVEAARSALGEGEAVREIFIAGNLLGNDRVQALLDEAEDRGIEIKILPDFLEMRMGEISVDDSLRIPILHLKPLSLHGLRYASKRFFDVSVSIIIVTVLFLPFLAVCLLIVLDSRGPVFFRQERVGFKEKRFFCLKFRTMRRDAEELLKKMDLPSFRGGPAFKMRDDPRITRVGRWLRRFSLDELPQIWNVLKGEMSLIGPRPQVLKEAEGNPDWARKRYRVLPGITGLWQVSGRADLEYEDMMRLDIYYLEEWSPGLDLKILLKTLPVILGGRGAY
ncbi:MAG: hypothetical protein A2902_04965 [Elusimicrobia bacterium RIFCSPLOWO2_01_FULL_64_13]|nr:MAG: hypothetical protein A2902_04965 [Elusimicrobia bacterium RIFCSPLOWO2_01_FULL_64_13]